MTRKSVIFILFSQEIALIIISILWLFFRNHSYIKNEGFISLLHLSPFKGFAVDLKTTFFAILASILLLFLSFIITFTYPPFKKSLEAIDELILSKIKSPDIIPIAMLSGIGEELFFRGILQDEIGIYWSSLIFALLHFPGKDLWVYSLWALFASLYLGNLYSYTGNLYFVIVVHTLNNLLALILWKKFRKKIIVEKKDP